MARAWWPFRVNWWKRWPPRPWPQPNMKPLPRLILPKGAPFLVCFRPPRKAELNMSNGLPQGVRPSPETSIGFALISRGRCREFATPLLMSEYILFCELKHELNISQQTGEVMHHIQY